MENNPLLLSGTIFITIVLVYITLNWWYSNWKKEQDILKRTQKWCDRSKAAIKDSADEKTAKPEKSKSSNSLWTILGLPGAKKKEGQESIYSGTPLFYQRAGIYDATSLRSYQLLRYFLGITPFLLFVFYYFSINPSLNPQFFFLPFFLAYIGFNLPVMWLKFRAKKRRKGLDRTFPDAIDLLMVCIEAGMGIDSAIRRVAKEIHVTSPELAKEFQILSLELKTGRPRNLCLRNLAQRTNLPDIDNLVSLLIQAEKYGTGVAKALQIHAEEMRQKRYSRLEEEAAKLPVKLVIPLILFIFPALFVVIIAPGAIQIFRALIQEG